MSNNNINKASEHFKQLLENQLARVDRMEYGEEKTNYSQLENLKVYHMSVSFSNDKIIFDRKLTPGVGRNHYGIKIAEQEII